MSIVYARPRHDLERVLASRPREELAGAEPKGPVVGHRSADRDTEEAFSSVPYEKGRVFLTTSTVKFGRERVAAFMRGYFEQFFLQERHQRALRENSSGESAGPFFRARRPRSR